MKFAKKLTREEFQQIQGKELGRAHELKSILYYGEKPKYFGIVADAVEHCKFMADQEIDVFSVFKRPNLRTGQVRYGVRRGMSQEGTCYVARQHTPSKSERAEMRKEHGDNI